MKSATDPKLYDDELLAAIGVKFTFPDALAEGDDPEKSCPADDAPQIIRKALDELVGNAIQHHLNGSLVSVTQAAQHGIDLARHVEEAILTTDELAPRYGWDVRVSRLDGRIIDLELHRLVSVLSERYA